MANSLDVLAPRVEAAAVVHRADALRAVQQLFKRRAADPQPVAGTDAPVCVDQLFQEMCQSCLPGDPQVPSSQEARHRVASHVVYPAFLYHIQQCTSADLKVELIPRWVRLTGNPDVDYK